MLLYHPEVLDWWKTYVFLSFGSDVRQHSAEMRAGFSAQFGQFIHLKVFVMCKVVKAAVS